MIKLLLLATLFGCPFANAIEVLPLRELPRALECSQVLRDLVRVRNIYHLEPDELAREPYYQYLSFLKDEHILNAQEYDLIQIMIAMHFHEAAFRFVRSLEVYRQHRETRDELAARDLRRATRKMIEIGQILTRSLSSHIQATNSVLSVLSFFSAVLQDKAAVESGKFMGYLDDLLINADTLGADPLAIINESNIRKVLLRKSRDFEPELMSKDIKRLLEAMSPKLLGI